MDKELMKSEEDIGRILGDMYARWTLDPLVEIARAVSQVYFSMPEYFQGGGAEGDVPPEIVSLWLSYGTLKGFPNKDQRRILAGAVFGDSDGYSPPRGTISFNDDFRKVRKPLFDAVMAAEETSSPVSTSAPIAAVKKAVQPLQNYLLGFRGEAFSLSYQQINSVSELAFRVLRSKTVASYFVGAVQNAISEEWPLVEDDGTAARLLPVCVDKLTLSSGMPKDFSGLALLARAGQEAIKDILTNNFDKYMETTYLWAKFAASYTG